MPKTMSGKFLFSILMGGLFIALAHPNSYNITNSFFDKFLKKDSIYNTLSRCPTPEGHLLHTVIFLALIYVIMLILNMFYGEGDRKPKMLLFKYAFYSALLFHTLSSSGTYGLIASKFGENFSTDEGCAKTNGILLHAVIFFLIKYSLMLIPKKC